MEQLDLTQIWILCAAAATGVALNVVAWVYGRLEKNPLDIVAITLASNVGLARPSVIMSLPKGVILFVRAIGLLTNFTALALSIVSFWYGEWWHGIALLVGFYATTTIFVKVMFGGGALTGFFHLASWLLAPLSLGYLWYYSAMKLLAS